jgi:hypothetical protein
MEHWQGRFFLGRRSLLPTRSFRARNPGPKARKRPHRQHWPGTVVLWTCLGCAAEVRPTQQDEPLKPAATTPSQSPDMSAVDGRDGASAEAQPEIGRADALPLSGSQSAGQVEMCGTGDPGACPSIPLCESDAGACDSTCPGCFINGSCVADASANPDNRCLICDAARNSLDWSTNDGGACDDGLFCTIDDVCTDGVCSGGRRECEDGVACNGVSTCDESSGSCTASVNGCGANAICDVATDTCKTTCSGCLIDGVCIPSGSASNGNPCLTCDPSRSTTSFTVSVGTSCGAAATACSGQDTCDAQGRCQPNNLPAGTACGSPSSSTCDQADACDGNGSCQQRLAQNGTPCDDGAFCTTGDQCQAGQCVASGQQSCGVNRFCNEAANQCQCQGCQIGNSCVAAGATNATNPCQVCDPNRSTTALSANTGAQCGAAATNCSGQDTCNAQGQCVANDLTNGTACTPPLGGSCQGGSCVACSGCVVGASCIAVGVACTGNRVCAAGGQCVPPFVCGEASPPRGAFPPEQVFTGSLTGGTILDGAYVETQQLQPAGAFTIGQSFTFRGPFVHSRTTEFFDASDPGGPLNEAVGTYSTNGNMLMMGLINCETGGTVPQSFRYSASSTELVLIGASTTSISARFARQ